MKLMISDIIEPGNYRKERIAFKVISDCDLKFFVVHYTNLVNEGTFSNKPKETFWFPPRKVKAGDWVVLYSNSGQDSSKINEDGKTSYFYYWGLKNPNFIKSTDGVVLAEVESWQVKWKDEIIDTGPSS